MSLGVGKGYEAPVPSDSICSPQILGIPAAVSTSQHPVSFSRPFRSISAVALKIKTSQKFF